MFSRAEKWNVTQDAIYGRVVVGENLFFFYRTMNIRFLYACYRF